MLEVRDVANELTWTEESRGDSEIRSTTRRRASTAREAPLKPTDPTDPDEQLFTAPLQILRKVGRAADGRMSSAEANFSIIHGLLSLFTIRWLDASAHLSEETHNAESGADWGIGGGRSKVSFDEAVEKHR